jgi:hypothetical protein
MWRGFQKEGESPMRDWSILLFLLYILFFPFVNFNSFIQNLNLFKVFIAVEIKHDIQFDQRKLKEMNRREQAVERQNRRVL